MAGQPPLIGVTGAIGAGKSSVLQAFALRGCAWLSADAVVHTLYHQSRVRDAVVARFGGQVLDAAGEIDRVTLGRLVFGDANALEWLERFLHPLVDEHMRTWLAEAQLRDPPPPLVVYESPLLFEAEQPGTEVLHPVAVVIFSGLISSTLLDTFLTPAMFWLFGRKPAEALLDDKDAEAL